MQTVDLQQLTEFLEHANKHTYANAAAKKAQSLRPSSEDYHFEEGDFVYHDTYFGARDFIGEEVVYFKGKPVWAANFYGFIFDESAETKQVYNFLRDALMQEAHPLVPVRGPSSYARGDWSYDFTTTGSDLSRFSGEEEIAHDSKTVYRCF